MQLLNRAKVAIKYYEILSSSLLRDIDVISYRYSNRNRTKYCNTDWGTERCGINIQHQEIERVVHSYNWVAIPNEPKISIFPSDRQSVETSFPPLVNRTDITDIVKVEYRRPTIEARTILLKPEQ